MEDFIPLYENPYNNNIKKKDERNVFKPLYSIRDNSENIVSVLSRPINHKHKSICYV